MSAIFKNKKKLTELSLKVSTYEQEILDLRRDLKQLTRLNQVYQDNLNVLGGFLNYPDGIIFSKNEGKRLLFITANLKFETSKRVHIEQLCFNLYCNRKSYGYIHATAVYDEERLKHIYIREFIIHRPSQGYGSLLLREFLRYIAYSFGVRTQVKGWLSFVDEQDEKNKIRRNRLYQKFGFKFEGDHVILDDISLETISN